jgi:addiction module RelE/StbE family toxin
MHVYHPVMQPMPLNKAQQHAPPGLKLVRGFRDAALRGEWKGYRSSRLNQQSRVIYQVEGERLKVYVLDVTPHDYRRKS